MDLEELKEMDASGIDAKRLNAKEVIMSKSGQKLQIPSRRWNSETFWWRPSVENIHLDTESTNSNRKSPRFLGIIRRGDSFPVAGEARDDFWSISVRLHIPPSR